MLLAVAAVGLLAGLKRTKLTDVVLPTSGPTAGLLDADDGLSDEANVGDGATETEMRGTDEDTDEEEMEADTGSVDAQVVFTLLIS